MKRGSRRWLLWLLGLLIAASCGRHLGARWLVRVDGDLSRLEKTERHLVYSLPRDGWLSFRILPFHRRLRLVTTAEMPESVAETEGRYSLEWQLADANGEALGGTPQRYHFRSQTADGFYLDRVSRPFESRSFEIPLEHLQSRPTTLRVRLHQARQPISGAVVRALAFERVADFKVASRWHRLSPDGRRQLARWSVFSPDLLGRRERRNLMRHRWVPLPPSGSGRDFDQRVLHVRTDTVTEEATGDEPGWSLIPDLRGLINVPRAGLVRLVVHANAPESTGPPESLTLRWHPDPSAGRPSAAEPWQQPLTTADGPTVFSHLVEEAGQLEVVAPRPIRVRAFLDRGRRETEITPRPSVVRLYPLDAGDALEWRMMPATTLFRLDLRAPSGSVDPTPVSALAARYQLTGDRGQVVAEGTLTAQAPLSPHDLVDSGGVHGRISERSSHVLRLPSEVRGLRLTTAGDPLLVAAYNRPEEMIDVTRMTSKGAERDTWFWLRPARQERTRPAGEGTATTSHLLHRGERLDEGASIVGDDYQWQAFHPRGDWSGHYLLVPRNDAGTGRTQAAAATYRAIAAERPQRLRFISPDRDRPPRPRLIFLRSSDRPFDIRVRVDGAPLLEQTVAGRRGELRLPPISLGVASLEIEASATASWYVSHTSHPSARASIKRLAIGVDSEPLVIPYEKRRAGSELLSGRLFLPAGRTAPASLDLTLRGAAAALPDDLQPRSEWTLRQRRYVFEADGRKASKGTAPGRVEILTRDAGPLDAGQPFFFRFGSDLPPGRYQIVLSPRGAQGGYLTLSRRLPGVDEKRDLFIRRATEVTGDAS